MSFIILCSFSSQFSCHYHTLSICRLYALYCQTKKECNLVWCASRAVISCKYKILVNFVNNILIMTTQQKVVETVWTISVFFILWFKIFHALYEMTTITPSSSVLFESNQVVLLAACLLFIPSSKLLFEQSKNVMGSNDKMTLQKSLWLSPQ